MRVLCLSGGGVKGAYQVGVLKKWLVEDGIEYDAFCGSSVGSLNSSILAQFPTGKTLESWISLKTMWDGLSSNKVYSNWTFFGVLASLWKSSVYNSQALQNLITSNVDASKIKSSGKKLRTVAVSMSTGSTHVSDESDPDLVKRVMASSAFPVLFSPIELQGEQWSDGGLRNQTPLGEAIRMGADEVDIIMCSNPDLFTDFDTKSSAIPGRVLRSLEILTTQLEIDDLKICGYLNDLSELRPEFKKIKIRVVQPTEVLTSDTFAFDQSIIQTLIAKGYRDACNQSTG